MSIPNPGSDAALDAGCRCPVLDNGHGRHPADWPYWVKALDCPLHGRFIYESAGRDTEKTETDQ